MEESRPPHAPLSDLGLKQWHEIMLLPDSPNFIEYIYKAKGLTTATVRKAQQQMECLLASRPNVKPLMKRRGLTSRGAKISEKSPGAPSPVPVSEKPSERSSSPVAEPSTRVLEQPVQSETATFYVGISDTPSKDQSQMGSTEITLTSILNQCQPPGQESLPELSAPLSMNTTTSSLTPNGLGEPKSSSHIVGPADILTSPPLTLKNVSSAFKSIFDPAYPNCSTKRPIAKKSTTPRVKNKALKDKIGLIKNKYRIKDCQVVLYDYYKDYGNTVRYGEWDLSNSLESEVDKVQKNKDRKKKLPNKTLFDKKSKKKREAPKNGDHAIPRKIRKVGDNLGLQTAIHSNTMPKVRIILKHGDGSPMGMLEDSPKDEVNNANNNKENIIMDGLGSCDKAVWKQMPPPNQSKKGLDIRSVSCSTVKTQADELSKSDHAVVIRLPQTGAQTEKNADINKQLENDESASDKNMEIDINSPAKPLSADAVPAQVGTQLSVQGEPAVATAEHSPCSTTALSQVKDKPVISLEAYQARKHSQKLVQDVSLSALPTSDPAKGTPVPSPKDNCRTSPSLSHDGSQSPKPKLPPSANSSSPQQNGYTSPNRTPESEKHRRHTLISEESPKKSRNDPSPVSRETSRNASDPRRKLFLSVVTENNNNPGCSNFERVTSLPIDNMATAELDLTSVKLHPLLDRHRRTDHSQLKVVDWENCCCYRCNKVFPLYKDWSVHSRTCN